MRKSFLAAVIALGSVALAGCNIASDEAQVAATVAAIQNRAAVTPTATQAAINIICGSTPVLASELQVVAPYAKPGSRTASAIRTANSALAVIAAVCGGTGSMTASGLLQNAVTLWGVYEDAKAAVAQARVAAPP